MHFQTRTSDQIYTFCTQGKVTVLSKEIKAICAGTFVQEWLGQLNTAAGGDLNLVDVRAGVTTLFSIKDPQEQVVTVKVFGP